MSRRALATVLSTAGLSTAGAPALTTRRLLVRSGLGFRHDVSLDQLAGV